MVPHWRCLHGHHLALPENVRAGGRALCPLCGAVRDLADADGDVQVGQLALTFVAVSGEFPAPDEKPASDNAATCDGSELPTEEDAEGSDPGTLPTADFSPTGVVPAGAPAPSALTAPALPGVTIIEEIARGGMGVVYRAFDEKHGRDVALKTLQRMSPVDLVRFKREFRALADIAHPNLASLYELLSDGETWCFTMEVLQGVEFLEYVWSEFDLLQDDSPRVAGGADEAAAPRLTRRRLNRLYDALKQLAAGLHELHRAGKLHSDIKPSNVMVTSAGRLVLLDFGLIAEISRDEHGRVPEVIQGTPHYMSPEQAACRQLTAASDWYAVGVMLYEVLTGRLPFRDKSTHAMLRKQYEPPLPPSSRNRDVPPELDELCMALLEIDPLRRPTAVDVLRAVDADDLADALTPASATETTELVGRESHLGVLHEMLEEVRGGESRCVFVHGRSGMGKSSLVRSFLDGIQDRDTIVLEGRCYEQESVPFKALDSLIDALAAHLTELPEATVRELMPEDSLPLVRLFPVLGQAPGASDPDKPSIDSSDSAELRSRGLAGLRGLLVALGRRQPVVLYIDDLQWGDDDSANLLADLMRPPDSPRLLLLGSYRREDIGESTGLQTLAKAFSRGQSRPHRRDLPIDSLSRPESIRLALNLLGGAGRETIEMADRIAAESGGSPFFVWELAQHAKEGSGPRVASLELDEVIWSRVCRLPAEPRQLLEVFAVAGRPMRAAEAFEAIHAETLQPSLLAQLRTAHFIRTSERGADTIVETYHDRIRESVVNHLAAAKVRGHHLKLALVIEQASGLSAAQMESYLDSTPDFDEPAGRLEIDKQQWQRVFDIAHFFDAAEQSERALPYALAAAEQAWSQNALDIAEELFEVAGRGAAGASAARRFRIAEGLGDVLIMRGRYEQAQNQFEIAAGLAASLGAGVLAEARIHGKQGHVCFKQGAMEDSARHYQRALAGLGDPVPGNRFTQAVALLKESCVQVLHTYLAGWFVGRRPSDTEAQQRDLFRASLYDGLGYPYWFSRGPIPTLWTHLRHLNLSERYPPSQALGRACAVHAVMMTAIPLAERGAAYAEQAFSIHGDLSDRLGQGKARSFQTFALLALGRFREGAESGREAVRLLAEGGDVWEENMARLIYSQPLYYLGRLEEAYRAARKAQAIGVETGDDSAVAISLFFGIPAAPHAYSPDEIEAERRRPREDPLSSAAVIQAQALDLLLRADRPREAAAVLLEAFELAKQRGIRNPSLFCGVSWRATALRLAAEREPLGPARRRALSEARRAVKAALRITRKYRTQRPRALRERALLAGLDDKPRTAQRYFQASLQAAALQEAAYERALTLLACGEAGIRYGWTEAERQSIEGRRTIDQLTQFEVA